MTRYTKPISDRLCQFVVSSAEDMIQLSPLCWGYLGRKPVGTKGNLERSVELHWWRLRAKGPPPAAASATNLFESFGSFRLKLSSVWFPQPIFCDAAAASTQSSESSIFPPPPPKQFLSYSLNCDLYCQTIDLCWKSGALSVIASL